MSRHSQAVNVGTLCSQLRSDALPRCKINAIKITLIHLLTVMTFWLERQLQTNNELLKGSMSHSNEFPLYFSYRVFH